jgi:site-specific recombinase XerD
MRAFVKIPAGTSFLWPKAHSFAQSTTLAGCGERVLMSKVMWEVVRAAATRAGIEKLAPHDLRRIYARLCHLGGWELDQIQFLPGHVSIQTNGTLPRLQAEIALCRQRPNGH